MPITTITWTNLTKATVDGNGDLVNDNSGLDECYTNASGTGDSGGSSTESIASAQDWELRCTFGPDPSGRTFIGMNGSFSLDYSTYDYCLHVSTENNTSGTPHPPDSVFVYEGPAPNKTYRDGVWNEGDLLRVICKGGVVRYYVNCVYLYTSPTAPTYPLYAVASMACHDSKVMDAVFITGPGVGTGIAGMTQGAESGETCAASWTIPTVTALPQPPTAGAPRTIYFDEIEPDWGNFGHNFGDASSRHNTIQTSRIRRFLVEWDGLDQTQADLLDDHYDSTSGWLSFTATHPRTGESLTGCRYERYTRSPHIRYWSQARQAILVKYP
jgi:hypothetical protein